MILFISDTHIGSPLYKNYEPLLIEIMNPKYEMVIICGDLIDIQENDIEDIMESNEFSLCKLIKEISKIKPVIIIKGNHDPACLQLQEYFCDATILDKFEFNDMIVLHGHEFDYFLRDFSFINKILFYIQQVAERIGIDLQSWVRDSLNSIAAYIQHKSYNDLVLSIEKAAFEKYSGTYKYIVLGHLHEPKLINVDESDRWYINVGDWTHNRTYVVYDGENFNLISTSDFSINHGS